MTTPIVPSNSKTLAPQTLSKRLRPGLLFLILTSSACHSQEWAMGLGQEAQDPQESSSQEDPAPQPSQEPQEPEEPKEPDTEQESSEPEPKADVLPKENPEGPEPGEPEPDEDPEVEPDPEAEPDDDSDPEAEPEGPEPEDPICGDGIIQGEEECDDGNDVNTDACLSNCKRARCGDRWVWEGEETCDPGPGGDATQINSCAAVCGELSQAIKGGRLPTRICYGPGPSACQGSRWDCRGCRAPNP